MELKEKVAAVGIVLLLSGLAVAHFGKEVGREYRLICRVDGNITFETRFAATRPTAGGRGSMHWDTADGTYLQREGEVCVVQFRNPK